MVGVGGTSNYLGGDPKQGLPLDQQAVDEAFRWATVTGLNPLRIVLDGETTPLPMTPESLVSPLAVSNRVWVQLIGRRVVIIGAGNTVSGVPPGAVIMFAGAAVLPGYLKCDGQAVSRTGFPLLFAAIGTTYGIGNGSTTFNVPNMVNRFPAGYAPAAVGGAATHTMTIAEMPNHVHEDLPHTHNTAMHSHTTNAHSHGQNVGVLGGTPVTTNARGDYNGDGDLRIYPQLFGTEAAGVGVNASAVTIYENQVNIDWTGGGQPHNNLPPYLGVGFLIKH